MKEKEIKTVQEEWIGKSSKKGLGVHYALWEVTQKCNLRCIHCRADASPDKEESRLIKGEKAFKLIDELSEMKCPTLTLTGGEPLLRKDIIQLTKYASFKKIKTRIQSNGLLLTKKIANQLRDVGILSFGIGLDGSKAEINDKIRNMKGAFNRAITAIKILKERNIKVHVEFTVTKINIYDLSSTLDLLEKLGVDTFLARAVVFAGRANPSNSLFRLSRQDYRDFLKRLSKERKERKKIIINSQDPLYHLADQSLVDSFKKYGNIYSGKILSGCTVGLNMIHVRSNGDIGLCTFLPNITLGNVFEKSLIKIWKNRFNIPEVKRLINRNYEGKCRLCGDRFICGGCRARALCLTNNLFAQDPYCWKYNNV